MSISTFFSSTLTASPAKRKWFAGRSNNSSTSSATVEMADPKEAWKQDMFAMLNSIGTLYSVPYLLFQRGYDYSEIAAQLKLPVGTVKSRIFTARVKMKNMIAARRAA